MYTTHYKFIDLYTLPGWFGMAGLRPSVTQLATGSVDNESVSLDQRCPLRINTQMHTYASDLGMT